MELIGKDGILFLQPKKGPSNLTSSKKLNSYPSHLRLGLQLPFFWFRVLVSDFSEPQDSYLVDPASSHMLVSKIKPCMSKCK
jgi:hypothetical protein